METHATHIPPTIRTDEDGWIYLDDLKLQQNEAIEIAYRLTLAVRSSIDRSQVDRPEYYTSENILRRAESPLGQALTALKKVF